MNDNIDARIDRALKEIVNAPATPGEALAAGMRQKAAARARARGRAAILAAAGAALLLNAALAFGLALRAAASAGDGPASVAAALAGITLALLPGVPLLAAGDLAKITVRKKNDGIGVRK